MSEPGILSGKIAVVHKNESGQLTHFETIGKNTDGSYNLSQWQRNTDGNWVTIRFGNYDSAGALRVFNNYLGINFSSETSGIARNPLLPELQKPKDNAVKENKSRAKAKQPEKTQDTPTPQDISPLPAAKAEQKEVATENPVQREEEGDSPLPAERVQEDMPEAEAEYTGGTFLEDVEHWIPSLFEDAHKGIASLKSEMDEDVTEDNWVGKAIGSSVLDVLDTAMSFTEGIPLGLLDTRRIGEGIAKGTPEGVMEDVSRALNVLPQGRILRAVDRAITAVHVVESLQQGDIKTAALTGGLGAASMAGGKAAAKGIRNRLGATPPPPPKFKGKPVKVGKWAWKESEMDTTDFLRSTFKKGKWSEQITWKDGKKVQGAGRNPKDSTVPDVHNEKMKVAVETKRYEYIKKEDMQKFLSQAGGRHNNLPPGTKQWLVVDHRGSPGVDPVAKHAVYFKEMGGTSVFAKIFIMTDKGIFEF